MALTQLSDSELITGFQDTVINERELLVVQLQYLAELERRKLFFHCSSLWAYLVEELGMEGSTAERKIRNARMITRFPELIPLLESGKLNPTLLDLALGCAHREKLSDPELLELLADISGLSTRAAKREVASRYPLRTELPKDKVRPLTAEFSEVSFVASEVLLEKLEEIRGLLAQSSTQHLKLADLIDVLATEFIQRHSPVEKAKRAEEREAKKKQSEGEKSPSAPKVPFQSDQRTPHSALIHELTRKNGYQCSYLDPVTKVRCHSQYALQMDHVVPWSKGGRTELANMRFLCRNHHNRVSFLEFGDSKKYMRIKLE